MKTQHGSYSRAWRRFAVMVLQPPLRAAIKHVWLGREHFPTDGGVILAANHLSYADWPAVGLFSYHSGRFPVFLIKSSIFKVRGVGTFLRKIGELPVERGSTGAASVLKDAERAIRDGACVVIYPEGTASRDPGLWPMRAKTGVARLALTTGAPVIPVAIWGAQDVLPYGDKRPRLLPRKTVRMIAGPPVDLSAYAGEPMNAATLRAATATIMAEITALLAGLRGEQPPAEPYDPSAPPDSKPAGPREPSGAGHEEAVSRTDAASSPAPGAGDEGATPGVPRE